MSLMNILLCKTKNEVYSVDKENNQHVKVKESFSKLVSEKKAELFSKALSGNTEQSFQTGADSYTESEWKRLLREFDSAQSNLRNSYKVSNTKTDPIKTINTSSMESSEDEEKGFEMLLTELTTAQYTSYCNGQQDDIYYTFYSQDGIYCKKQGKAGFEWEIKFTNNNEYKKIMDFLQNFDTQDNLRFTCHEGFWKEFLSGQVNIDKFNKLTITEVYGDDEVSMPLRHRSLPDFVKDICYTTEEALMRFQPNVPEKDSVDHEVINLDRIDLYYAKHPSEIGKKNQFYNGQWYSFAELAMIWKKEFKELLSDDTIKKKVTFDNVYYNTDR